MPDTFVKIESVIKRKGRRMLITNAVLVALLALLAFIVFRVIL